MFLKISTCVDVKILFCLFHNSIHVLFTIYVRVRACVWHPQVILLWLQSCSWSIWHFLEERIHINLSFIIDQILYSFIIHSPIILSWNMIFKSFKQCNITPSFHCTIASLLFSSLSTGRVTMGSLTCFPTNMAMIHQQHVSKIMLVALK
jgi:hypothetical protein